MQACTFMVNLHTYDKVTVDFSTRELNSLLWYVSRFKLWYQMVQVGVDFNAWSMLKGFVLHMFRHFDIHLIFFRYGVFDREVFQRNTFVEVSITDHWFARYWIIFILDILPDTVSIIKHDIQVMKFILIK